MTCEGSRVRRWDARDREWTLFEYGTCQDPAQADWLYEHRQDLQPYLRHRSADARAFDDDGKPCICATDHVGLLPFSVEGRSHLLLIAPKGCRENESLGLRRFLELVVLGDGGIPPEEPAGWEGRTGPHRFLLFLAHHYANLLKELCRRDFRSYYRAEEDELRGFIRGRLNLSGYARLAVQGKRHVLPCRWDEFTVDNWDNRILWGVARRLKDVAASFDPHVAHLVWEPFQHLLSWFSPVADVPITSADLRKSRLGRTSRYYRRALAGREFFSREAICRGREVRYRRWSWMRRSPLRSLLKWSPGRPCRTLRGTLISSKSFRSSPASRAKPIVPTSSFRGRKGHVRWATQNTRMCWNGRPASGWELLKKCFASASVPLTGTNSTSTCGCRGLPPDFSSCPSGTPGGTVRVAGGFPVQPFPLRRLGACGSPCSQLAQATNGSEERGFAKPGTLASERS